MTTTTTANRDRLIGMLFGFFPAQVLQTVAQLDVAEHLAGGPLPVTDLAVRTATDPDALYRLVRAASILGLVELDPDGTVTVTPDGTLLRRGEPGSVGRLAMLFCGKQTWGCWGDMAESVRTGDNAWERLTGRSTFAFFDADPELSDTFTEAMAEGTRAAAPAIVDHTDLDGVSTLADLGGGNGTLLAAYLRANPGLRGILFDGPGAVGDAAEVLGGCPAEIVTGDFFTSVPAADAYVVKSVLHDWDDERSLAILASVRAAIPDGGALLVVEPVVPTDPGALAERHTLLMSDLNMLVCTGGKERTHAEFDDLLSRGGFRLESVTPCPPSGYSVLRAVPA
ncbi:methyltransferase [Pseudonocardia endophytica]|uniref:O-methyltransferase n=1 Tax=Pseudonocardia endophytica TaxID=401976 RepID=A0A4V2PHZ4_PSEEN|nr:methyltransferase [Pseudonocardia endophytica]TCK22626.1 O-methyltransferase [Pseudonocardia endophytica]